VGRWRPSAFDLARLAAPPYLSPSKIGTLATPSTIVSSPRRRSGDSSFTANRPKYGSSFPLLLWHLLRLSPWRSYGDVYIATNGGRVWACFHIVLSVAMLGEVISSYDELRTERQAVLARVKQVRRAQNIQSGRFRQLGGVRG
jgi:hypothetical protein